MTSMTGFHGPSGKSIGHKMTGAGDVIPKGYQKGQLQNFTPEQMQLFQSLFSQVGPQSYLSRLAGGDQGLFEEMEAPAHRQFQGLLGQIGSRFSGTGDRQMSGRRGSGFNFATTQAASDFAQDLQSRRQGLQRQALMDLMGISQGLLSQRPYDQFVTEKPRSFAENLFTGLSGGIGQGLGTLGSLYGLDKLGILGNLVR